MNKLNQTKELLITVLGQIEKYENKPTKAESARIRKTLGEIKKNVTSVRAELLEADKA